MREDFDLNNFTAGELSPRLRGRTDYQKYFNGAASLLNFVCMPQGGITRRPGTACVVKVADQANKPRLRRWQFNEQQSYMLEFGDGYVRVNADGGQVINPQAVTGATNNGAGLIRLALASAAGLYTGNTTTVTGVAGTVEANGTWLINNVPVTEAITGAANNGNGAIRLQVADTSHYINGGAVVVAGVAGTVEANGTWPCLVVDGTHLDLQGSVYVNGFGGGGTVSGNDAMLVDLQGSAFVHAYTGGGTATTIVQIPTPYATADLPALYFSQSDDQLYISHPNYPTATLNRSSNVQWAYLLVSYRDGPYLGLNTTTTSLSVSAGEYSGGPQIITTNYFGRLVVLNPYTPTNSITVTASSTLGINSTPTNVGQGFLPTDVGRHLRLKQSECWCWMIIAEVISATQVKAVLQPAVFGGAWGALDEAPWQPITYYPLNVIVSNAGNHYICIQAGVSDEGEGPMTGSQEAPDVPDGSVIWQWKANASPTSTKQWMLGKWTPGVYPYVSTFWQQRWVALGTSLQPNAIEATVTGDFNNFAPTAQDGTVVDTNALSFVISDDELNAIRWVKTAGAAQAAQLAIGTYGEEQILQAYSTSQALTPTNVQVYPETANGTAQIEPLRIGKSLLFVDRPGRKLLEWTFLWQVNGYDTMELSEASEHITASGVVAMAYAQAPHRLVWLLLANGELVSCAYLKNQTVFSPSRHVLGGQYYGGPPIVESIDVIPSPDLSFDQLWMSVLRTINGVPTRTIEVLTPWFENDTMPQEDAVCLDCSTSTVLPTGAATLTPSGLVNNPATLDAPPSWTGTATLTVTAGDMPRAATLGSVVRINGGLIVLESFPSAFVATGQVIRPLTSLAPAPAGTWTVSPVYTEAENLAYLNGETVGIYGDGADYGTAVVTGGSVPLAQPGASMITVGFNYTSFGLTMPFEPIRAAGATSSGKAKRVDSMWVRFFETLGATFGRRITDPMTNAARDVFEDLQTRTAGMLMGQAPPLYSGAKKLRPQGGFDNEGQVLISTKGAGPLTVLSIFAKADVGDMPDGRP